MQYTVMQAECIEQFFNAIAYKAEGYVSRSFSYLAIRKGDKFRITEARLLLNTGPLSQAGHFQSDHVRAGRYDLDGLGLETRQVVDALISGSLSMPEGELIFAPDEGTNLFARFEPLSQAGLVNQSRFDILTLMAGPYRPETPPHLLEWELKASATPYDSLQELASEFGLGPLQGTMTMQWTMNVEVIAFNVASIDASSVVSGARGLINLRLAPGLDRERASVGYREFSNGRVLKRGFMRGADIQWAQEAPFQTGNCEIEASPAAVIHCIASYSGIAQAHFWIGDPTTAQNSRRVAYELVDSGLQVLNEFLTKSGRGRDARDLETGVGWLLWMLGFSVIQLGGIPKTQDAVDLMATTPAGHIALIECTTGLLKADHKLPRVVQRTEMTRKRLLDSGNAHLRVLPVMVTSKTRGEIAVDLEQAEKLRVLVITRENLDQSGIRTLTRSNADQLFAEAEQAVEAAAAKHENQPMLPSMPLDQEL